MPLSRCGSVSARLSVWFSRVSALAKLAGGRRQHLEPAGIVCASSASPRTRYSDARRFEPASVRINEPFGKIECRQADLAGIFGECEPRPSRPSESGRRSSGE